MRLYNGCPDSELRAKWDKIQELKSKSYEYNLPYPNKLIDWLSDSQIVKAKRMSQ